MMFKLKKYLLIVILSFLTINNNQKNLPVNPNEQPKTELVVDDHQNSLTTSKENSKTNEKNNNNNKDSIKKKYFILFNVVCFIIGVVLVTLTRLGYITCLNGYL